MLHYLQNLFQAMDFSSLTDAVLRVAAVFLCLTVHETCHGLAALALGDPTAKSMHRLSLNPLRHIDWFGLALMFGSIISAIIGYIYLRIVGAKRKECHIGVYHNC